MVIHVLIDILYCGKKCSPAKIVVDFDAPVWYSTTDGDVVAVIHTARYEHIKTTLLRITELGQSQTARRGQV